jgi:hypothetical protein
MATTFASARHQAALSTPTGYRRFSRFTFSRSGRTVELEPISGSMTQDARRTGRWDARLTFSGTSMLPTRPSDILTPFGTRVEAEMGLELLDGSVATVPYGTYEIGTMINSVVTNRTGINPGVSLVGASLGAARTFGLDSGTAPWSEVLDVLNGFSRTAWYDRVGHIQVGTITPDPAGAYPLDLLTSISADYDTRPPNVIVARGEAQDGTPPVQAVALDSDPSSPTYAGAGPGTSPYGRVTEYFSSPLILSVAQAQSAADALLAQNIGAAATYTLVRPYDPTITAGDVVAVGGTILIVDAVTVDLTGDTSLAVREL